MIVALLAAALACLAQERSPEELIVAGHWKRARTLVEQRPREAPQDPNAIFLSSQIRNAFGDRVSPPDLAEKAVRMDGRVARYHRELAEVQGVMAQHAGVLQQVMLARRFRKEIDIALQLDPRDVQAWRDLMEFYLLAPGIVGGDTKKAEAIAGRIIGIDEAAGFLAKARIAEFGKDQAGTEAMLRRAAAVRPPAYRAQVALAEFYLEPGHRNDASAEALAKTALAVDSGRAAAYSILAASYAAREDWGALESLLSAAAGAVPDDPTPSYRAADRLLADRRDPARAERYLRAYLAQDPEGNAPTAADAHWKLGLALHSQQRDEPALEEWKVAVQLDPESPAARELRQLGSGKSSTPKNRGVN